MSIRSLSIGAGLILGALAVYVPRPLPVAPVPIAVSVNQPAPPPVVATALVPLESVRVSIARLPVPKASVPKEVIVAQAARQIRKLSADTLCLSPRASRECQATFATALQSASLHAEVQAASSSQQPLRFHKRAAWVRRLETVGKEGIPFMRVPRGQESELVVGIDRKGVLGFSLRKISDRER